MEAEKFRRLVLRYHMACWTLATFAELVAPAPSHPEFLGLRHHYHQGGGMMAGFHDWYHLIANGLVLLQNVDPRDTVTIETTRS